MRNGQNNKHRMRGRNNRSGGGGKSHNPLTRVYELNGPDVKIRGTANHVAEKYIQLARDATASGDPVAAENYYQHAEHYFRLIAVAQEQFRQTQPFQQREGGGEPRGNDDSYDDGDDSQPNYGSSEPYSPREQSYQQPQQPRDSQPYQQREQPRGDYQPRHDRNRDNRQDNRHDNNRSQDSRRSRSQDRVRMTIGSRNRGSRSRVLRIRASMTIGSRSSRTAIRTTISSVCRPSLPAPHPRLRANSPMAGTRLRAIASRYIAGAGVVRADRGPRALAKAATRRRASRRPENNVAERFADSICNELTGRRLKQPPPVFVFERRQSQPLVFALRARALSGRREPGPRRAAR